MTGQKRKIPGLFDTVSTIVIILVVCFAAITFNARIVLSRAETETKTEQNGPVQPMRNPRAPTVQTTPDMPKPTPVPTPSMDPDDPDAWPVDGDVPAYVFLDGVPLDKNLQAALQDAAREFDIDYAVALAVPQHETRFQNLAGDNGNSIGYFQIQPKWWGWLMDGIGVTDLWDPVQNFRGGCAIIQYLTDKKGGLEAGLHGYNPGYRNQEGKNYETVILEKAAAWQAVLDGIS